jgi:hypothetical protein
MSLAIRGAKRSRYPVSKNQLSNQGVTGVHLCARSKRPVRHLLICVRPAAYSNESINDRFLVKGPVEPKVPPALASRRSSSSLAHNKEENKPTPARRPSMSNVRPSSAQQIRVPASTSTPEIAPRSNRSAMLRAAKMAATPSKATRA